MSNEGKTVKIHYLGTTDDGEKFPVENIPNADELPVGEIIYMRTPEGQPVPMRVVSVEDGVATFDMNHPLAGKPLNFDLELVEVA